MPAFSQEEHYMMRGIWGELETMNRSLTLLVELLENQETPPPAPKVGFEGRLDVERQLALVKATRRANGWCLLCGATRKNAGEGCYKVDDGSNKWWAPHSWPEGDPNRCCTDCGSITGNAFRTKCLACAPGV